MSPFRGHADPALHVSGPSMGNECYGRDPEVWKADGLAGGRGQVHLRPQHAKVEQVQLPWSAGAETQAERRQLGKAPDPEEKTRRGRGVCVLPGGVSCLLPLLAGPRAPLDPIDVGRLVAVHTDQQQPGQDDRRRLRRIPEGGGWRHGALRRIYPGEPPPPTTQCFFLMGACAAPNGKGMVSRRTPIGVTRCPPGRSRVEACATIAAPPIARSQWWGCCKPRPPARPRRFCSFSCPPRSTATTATRSR